MKKSESNIALTELTASRCEGDTDGTVSRCEAGIRRKALRHLSNNTDDRATGLTTSHTQKNLLKLPSTSENDGNSLFRAMADSLRHLGRGQRTHVDIRRETVDYLRRHPRTRHGINRVLFIDPSKYPTDYEEFVAVMAEPGTQGDYTCLQAMHELYMVNIRVLHDASDRETVFQGQGQSSWPKVDLCLTVSGEYTACFSLPECPAQCDIAIRDDVMSDKSEVTAFSAFGNKTVDKKHYLPGFGPYSSWIFTTLQFYSALLESGSMMTHESTDQHVFQAELHRLVAALTRMKQALITFHHLYPQCKAVRVETLVELGNVTDKLESLHDTQRSVDITKVTTASVGVVSGAAVITGIALAPFTFCASLPLTVVGLTVATGATATGIGASAVKAKRERDVTRTFDEIRKTDVLKFGELNACLDDIQHLDARIKELVKVIQTNQEALVTLCNIREWKLAENSKHLPAALRSMKALTLIPLDDLVVQAAVGTGKIASRAVGFIFSGIGIAIDVAELAMSARSIDAGSVNDTAQELSATIALMQNQLERTVELHELIRIDEDAAVDEDINALYFKEEAVDVALCR